MCRSLDVSVWVSHVDNLYWGCQQPNALRVEEEEEQAMADFALQPTVQGSLSWLWESSSVLVFGSCVFYDLERGHSK